MTNSSTFIHPRCDVPVKKPVDVEFADLDDNFYQGPSKEEKETLTKQHILNAVPANCVWVWTCVSFTGILKEICKPLSYVGKELDNKISSFAAGSEAQGYLFELSYFKGKFLYFSKGTNVEDWANYMISDFTLQGLISSI